VLIAVDEGGEIIVGSSIADTTGICMKKLETSQLGAELTKS
jgi:hypothetical protein